MQQSYNSDDTGWVKIHRRIYRSARCHDPDWVTVWLYILLNARHEPGKAIFDGEVVQLAPGQLITGRYAIASATGVNPSKVKRLIQVLKTDLQIDQRAGVKGSIITVLNWAAYQNLTSKMTSDRPASGQQVDTNKKGENGKNGKEEPPPGVQGVLLDPLDIPPPLRTQPFTNAWQRWMTFRRGMRGRKPKDWGILFGEQLKWLAGFGEPTAHQIIEQSIRNGWQGLFELKNQPRRDNRDIKPGPGPF